MQVYSLIGQLSNASLQPFRNANYAYLTYLPTNDLTYCRILVGSCEAFMALKIHCLVFGLAVFCSL
jgi:hypothetical protein